MHHLYPERSTLHDATGKSRPGICIATKAIAVSGRKRGDSSDGDASMRSDYLLLLWTPGLI
jgi:hypothetical protein